MAQSVEITVALRSAPRVERPSSARSSPAVFLRVSSLAGASGPAGVKGGVGARGAVESNPAHEAVAGER